MSTSSKLFRPIPERIEKRKGSQMKRRIVICMAAAMVLFAATAATPPLPAGSMTPPVGAIGTAKAAVSKSRGADGGGGGGNVSRAGDRLGELLSGWAVPVLTVIAGCLLVGALASRNIGASVGIVVISLIGLVFLLTPEAIQSLAKGIADFVF
jgi:hypothetical protein